MYVARQVFTAGLKGQKPRKVQIGDAVPEAEHWDEMTVRSHLNMGWIEKVPGDYPKADAGQKKPKPRKPAKPKQHQEATQVDQAS